MSLTDDIADLEERAANDLGLDPAAFVRSELREKDEVVAVGTAFDAGLQEVLSLAGEGGDHGFYASVCACCFGASGSTTVEVDPASLHPGTAPIAAKMLARALDLGGPTDGVLVPEWADLIGGREDFAHLGQLRAHWTVDATRSRFAGAWLAPLPGGRDAPRVARAFYETRLRRSAARYQRLIAMQVPAVLLENELRILRGNVEQLRARGYLDAVVQSLPEELLATVREHAAI